MSTTIRFGTTSGPCTTAAAERAQLTEEADNHREDEDDNGTRGGRKPEAQHQVEPCSTAAEPPPEKPDTPPPDGEKGNCDPNKLLQCPFDKNHLIRACRFPYHLIKCKKNHPKLAQELKTCPFNARHLVPKHELRYHTETCEDRRPVDTSDDGVCKWQIPPVSTWVSPDMTEDWDKEVDDAAAPFVWGVNAVLNGNLKTSPTNNLGPTFRTPTTFPWSGL